MKKAHLLFFVLLISIVGCSPSDSTKPSFVIQNVNLFDGDSVIPKATVVIKNGIISDIRTGSIEIYIDQEVIDGEGKTLIPGLINAHVHAWQKEHTEEAVQSGVLTMLDLLNNDLESVSTLKTLGNSSSSHAYYYSAGNTVTVAGGHGTQFGLAPVLSEVGEASSFIDERIQEGSDYIKLMIESGSESNPRPTLSDEMIERIIEKTKNSERLSIAHITRRSDALKAAKLGVNGFAHMWYRDTDAISDEEVELLKESRAFMIPTLIVWQKVDERFGTIDMDLLKQDLLKLHQAGIPVLAGTDPPNAQVNYGTDLHNELRLLVETGLTPLEALKSATSVPSSSFKLGEKGFIKKGYSADFILIDGDPTQDIQALGNIEAIWKQGDRINN